MFEWQVNLCRKTATARVRISRILVKIKAEGKVLSATQGDSYQWFVNGVPVPGATGSTFTPQQEGSYTVAVTLQGTTATSPPFVLTAFSESELSRNIRLYPNPTTGTVELNLGSVSNGQVEVVIWSQAGKEVKGVLIENAKQRSLMDVSSLPQGMYMIGIHTSKGKAIKKLIKQ